MGSRLLPIRLGCVVALLLGVCTHADDAGARSGAEPRILLIAIDAVPFEIMEELVAEPENRYLRSLQGPVPLISTFPSTTSLALAAILQPLGVEASPGYEAKHYDWDVNRVSGGGFFSYDPFPWRQFFDWKVEGLMRKAFGAIRPYATARKDIRQSLKAFLRSDAPVFTIYYDTTDSAGHLRSPEGLKPILRDLDRSLFELTAESPDLAFHAVLFSDHGLAGGEPLRNARKRVVRNLRREGLRVRKRIRKHRDVVIVPFGLVSSFVAYTSPGREDEVASIIAGAEGVDLCTAREEGGYRIEADTGLALLRRSGSDPPWWRYTWQGEDPLQLGETLHRRFEEEGWLPDRQVFELTRRHHYPDPFHRIASSFRLVENPASVVCSISPGYMYGSKLTTTASRLSVGRLQWTHGALEREASLGFLMTDVPGWSADGALRFDEALAPLIRLEQAAEDRPVTASR